MTPRSRRPRATSIPSPLLFLSHAGSASNVARDLIQQIETHPLARASGLKVWSDLTHLQPGTPWQEQLETAITQLSTAFAVVLTPETDNGWVRMEVRLALDRVAKATRDGTPYPFVPVLTKKVDSLEKLPQFARSYQGVQLGAPHFVDDLVRGVLQTDRDSRIALIDEPFMGLAAFTAAHSHLFYGREQETQELIEVLRSVSFTMVVGHSGSGKSSLVRAGLIPAFYEGMLADPFAPRPDSSVWHVVDIRPQSNPFESLIEGVSRAARHVTVNASLLGDTIYRLRTTYGTSAFCDLLREGAPPHARVLLVVDQFEELWTQTSDYMRTPFLDGLLAFAEVSNHDRFVVVTMRRDYYHLVTTHSGLFTTLEATDRLARYNLRHMSDQSLQLCIRQPLALAGVDDSEADDLAEAVLKDAVQQPGELALIEMALTETWRERHNHRSLLRAYRAIGRVEGALNKAAEDVYNALSVGARELCDPLFMRLVRLGDTGGTTRRTALSTEFSEGVWQLAQNLGTQEYRRLLVLGGPDVNQQTVELAHEQMVTQWPRYQQWLTDTGVSVPATHKRTIAGLARELRQWNQSGRGMRALIPRLLRWLGARQGNPRATDKRTLDHLMDEVRLWNENGRKRRDLSKGSSLKLFRDLRASRPDWLSPQEWKFVGRSYWYRLRAVILRATLVLILVVASAGLVALQNWRAREAAEAAVERQAASLWYRFDLAEDYLRPAELDALAEVTVAEKDLRVSMVRQMLATPALARRFSRAPEILLRALIGIDPDTRRSVIRYLMVSSDPAPGDPAIAPALADLIVVLEDSRTAAPIIAGIVSTTDEQHLVRLTAGLARVMRNFDSSQAAHAAQLIINALATAADPNQVAALISGLGVLGQELSIEHAAQATSAITEALERADANGILKLAQSLAAVGPHAVTEDMHIVLAPTVIAMMETAVTPSSLWRLARALRMFGAQMSDDEAERAITMSVDWIKDRGANSIGDDFAEFGLRVGPRVAQQTARYIIEAFDEASYVDHIALSHMLRMVAASLNGAQSALGESLLKAMRQQRDSEKLAGFAYGMSALMLSRTSEQVNGAAELLRDAMKPELPEWRLATLGEAMVRLGHTLDAESTMRVGERIVGAIEREYSPLMLARLVAGLEFSQSVLSAERAERIGLHIIESIERVPGRQMFPELAQAVRAIVPYVEPDAADRLATAACNFLARTSNPHHVQMLAEMFEALAPRLTDRRSIVHRIVSILRNPFTAGEATERLLIIARSVLNLPPTSHLWAIVEVARGEWPDSGDVTVREMPLWGREVLSDDAPRARNVEDQIEEYDLGGRDDPGS